MMSKLDYLKALSSSSLVTLALFASPTPAAEGVPAMDLNRMTPVIFTDEVDSCVAFWTERLGFELTVAVPAQQSDQTGSQFAIITNGSIELMYQSFASADAEVPGLVAAADPRSISLFIEVADLDAAIARMDGLTPVMPRHAAFYGADEISYRSSCGTVVTFAQFAEQAPSE
jgi:uncharacterized glyoxalase superfamily protein PhnB